MLAKDMWNIPRPILVCLITFFMQVAILDSQYVIKYTYQTHILDSASLNQSGGGVMPSHQYCGPYYYDILTMNIIDPLNLIDTLQYSGGSTGIALDPLNPNNILGEDIFLLNPGNPPGPDTEYRLYYLGQINTMLQNGVTYTNVAVFQNQYNALYTYYFTCTTDLYLCLGFGIVKKVEHTTNGDKVWKLIRSHIM
jgi:hypothetical protein